MARVTIRRIFRFITAAIFCAFIAFATLVIGVLIGDQADEVKAGNAAFIEAFNSGDTGQIIMALTGAPFALSCFLLPLAFGCVLEWKRKRSGSFRHRGKSNRKETTSGETWARTAAAPSASGD